jgi:hypothetical protein
VAYYAQSEMTEHISYVVISDCLKHDTAAVHLFQGKLCSFLSDGAALQYKCRKYLINICYKDDSVMDAECHFFAISQCKAACNGTRGTIKVLARKTRLQNPYEKQIMTSRQLYELAVRRFPHSPLSIVLLKTTAKKH